MISVLYVDDEPDLLELAQLFLERAGEFRVGTSTSAQKILDSPSILSYDAIVSDYQMPGMDGIAFLKAVRERFGDIPFILFTGKGREEVVIDAINNGADFYLQKGGDPRAQFAELTHKIRQAVSRKQVEDALRRKNEELNASYEQITASEEELRSQYEELARSGKRIRENEEKFRSLFEKTHDALVLFTDEGCIDCNRRALELFGYPSKEDLLGLTPADVSPPLQPDGQDSRAAAAARIRTVFESGGDHFEWLQQRKDGSTFLADILLSAFELDGKKVFLSSARDITERRRMEDELRLLKISVEQSSDEVFWMDFDGTILYVNDAACRITGYSRDELLTMKIFELDPDFPPEVWVQSVADLRQRKNQFITTRHRRKNGEIIDVEIVAVYVSKDNREYSFAFVRDITERRLAEQNRQNTIAFLNALIDQNPNPLWISDEKGFLIRMNPACSRLLHSTEEELAGKYNVLNDNIVEEQGFMPLVRSVFEEGRVVSFPLAYDSSRLDSLALKETVSLVLEITIFPIKDAAGKFTNAVIIHNDITKRVRAERVLAESEERYRTLVNSSFDGIAIHQEGILVYVNQTAARLLGSDDPAYFIGKPALDIVHPDDRAQIADRIRQAREKPQELVHEQFLRADGRPINVDVATTPCTWQGIPATYVTFRDTSGQKRGEEALRESEEKFRALVETSSDFIWEVDARGVYTYISPKIRDMLGYDPEEIIGKTPFDLMSPDEAARVAAEFNRYLEAWQPFAAIENANIHKDGTVVILETSGVPWFAKDGTHSGYRGIDRDITARKRAEEALRDSEEKFRTIVDTTSEWIWEIDLEGRHTYSNPAIESILGYRPEEILSGNTFDLMHPEDREKIREMLPALIRERKGWRNLVIRWRHRDSSWHYLESNAIPVFDHQDRMTGFRGADRDITKRKKAEEALRESEEKYRRILENMQDAYFRTDSDGYLTMVNPSAVRMYGYSSPDEMIGIPAATLYRGSEQRQEMIRKLQEQGRISDFSGTALRKDGTTFWASLSVQFIAGDDGRIDGTEGIVRDVTDRKSMEQAIQEANKKLNLLNSITRHDVANQLTVLQGYAQLAAMKEPDPVTVDFLRKIEATAETIARQIEFTKTYQELGIHTPAWFRLDETVAKTGRSEVNFSNTCRAVEILADPMLERVFFNLFENAIRHGEHVTEITVRCERAPDGLAIIVEDDGIGVAPEEKETIFGKGFGKNTGFGLFLAREILAITGITIRETGYAGVGARFEITVPKEMWRNTAGQ